MTGQLIFLLLCGSQSSPAGNLFIGLLYIISKEMVEVTFWKTSGGIGIHFLLSSRHLNVSLKPSWATRHRSADTRNVTPLGVQPTD